MRYGICESQSMISGIKATHVDQPEVGEVFADHIRQVSFNENLARIEFCVTRLDEVKPPNPPTGRTYTSARVVLSPTAILQLHSNLASLVAMLEKQGLVQRSPEIPQPASH